LAACGHRPFDCAFRSDADFTTPASPETSRNQRSLRAVTRHPAARAFTLLGLAGKANYRKDFRGLGLKGGNWS